MLNPKDLIKVINLVTSKGENNHYCGITYRMQPKPLYRNGNNNLKVCGMNLQCCKQFYKTFEASQDNIAVCPFGMKVQKKTFETSTTYKNITLYSIIGFEFKPSALEDLADLPRHLKDKKPFVINELTNLNVEEGRQLSNHESIAGLIETLLVGRVAIAIQTISHQFFTPLQGAMADIKNIEANIDVHSSTQRLLKNFNSLNKLATEIQLLLSISEEFNRNMLRKVTVHNMVAEIFQSLISVASEKHINLYQGFNQYKKVVDAIPGQMSIALSNIIQNAVKYSYTGHPGFPLNVSVTYEGDEEFLIIIVKNEGCKITQEEIKDRLIFSLGYRGEYSGDRQRGGTGTGLFIANNIVNAHGGFIDVTSNLTGGNIEQGTDRYMNTFYIKWPLFID
jgi:signal transduction histidine kinase